MRRSLLVLLIACSANAFGQIDPSVALRYFQEAKWASDDDGGKLWGKALYGPLILVDRETRFAIANQPDKEGKLIARDGVWAGQVPVELGVANTSISWGGVHWSMVMWPVTSAPTERARLFMHESFHRIQEELGLAAVRPDNAHLDAKAGRIWLKLEWRALAKALIAWGPERKQSIEDALTFRAYRRGLYPLATAEEDRMEMNEGLAEYTGVRLMGLGDWGTRSYLAGRLKIDALKPSYPFSFAYETGPAYGLLLDMDSKDWRGKTTVRSSLSEMLRSTLNLSLPSDIAKTAMERAQAYDGASIFTEEEARETERLAKEKRYRSLLIDGPVLMLPLAHSNSTYNPNEIVPLGAAGTVYPTSQVSDDWGTIEVEKGVLMGPRYDVAYVSAPKGAFLMEGDGWKLTLKTGWKVVPGKRKGDFAIVRS